MATATSKGGAIARKGVGMLLSATRSGVSAISKGMSKARKEYAHTRDADVVAQVRQSGVDPVDLLFQALRRIYFLYVAGYKSELVAAAAEAGKRLTDADKSSVPVDVVRIFENTLREEAQSYGARLDKGSGFLAKRSRVPKDHSDRTSVVDDVYYALLATSQAYGREWHKVEQACREASVRVIGNAIHATDDTKDARAKAAKALSAFGVAIKAVVDEASPKRQFV